MLSEANAASLLRKLGDFTRTLEPGERSLFAALVGPGVEKAIRESEVEGFARQESDRLVRALTELARRDERDQSIGDADGESS